MREEVEVAVLKVGSETIPAKFAGSVFKNYEEGKSVQARALGSRALHNMLNGIIKAQAYFESHNMYLYNQITKSRETFENGDSIEVFTTFFYVSVNSID